LASFPEKFSAMPLNKTWSVLIAEDNPADVFLITQALKRHDLNCDVRVIADGQDAIDYIDLLQANEGAPYPDVVVLDMHLPKRTGDEVLKRLRSSSRGSEIPVVVLTGSDSPQDRQRAEAYRVYYFKKSSSVAEFFELGAVVKRLCGPDKPEESGLLHNTARGM
jgi:two-component system, chemotaxis family, response regulator Rcp1